MLVLLSAVGEGLLSRLMHACTMLRHVAPVCSGDARFAAADWGEEVRGRERGDEYVCVC